jgi:MSHA pilin protein MshC
MIVLGTMKQNRTSRIDQRGFTMIEMVAVLIIMAIFATVVATRFAFMDTDTSTEAEILKSSLRFAQIKALNNAVDNNTWGIHFTSGGSSYSLVYTENGTTTSPVNLPGECGSNPLVCISTPTHTLPRGMTINGSSVNFNRWGSPGPSDVAIVLQKAGLGSAQVTVTKNTGHIP